MENSSQNTEQNSGHPLDSKPEQQKAEDMTAEQTNGRTSSESSAFAQVMTQMNIADINAFDVHYEKLWQEASENKEILSVLICEIDYFNAYNTHYGHQAAAFMLLVVALELKKKCEEFGFFLARYKADKFVILIKGSELKKVEEVAESLRHNVEKSKTEHKFSKVSNVVTLSIGTSNIYPTSMKMLMQEADNALCVAQISGNKHASLSLVKDIKVEEKTDKILTKTATPLTAVIPSSTQEKPLIKSTAEAVNKSPSTLNFELTQNKKEALSEEVDMISRLKGVTPSPDELTLQPKNQSNEKPDMLSRFKKMMPSSDKLALKQEDTLTEEVDMISRLKGIAPSPNTVVPPKEELAEKGDKLSRFKNMIPSSKKLDVQDEEKSNYDELKEELEKLKRKSEGEKPPPVRYY